MEHVLAFEISRVQGLVAAPVRDGCCSTCCSTCKRWSFTPMCVRGVCVRDLSRVLMTPMCVEWECVYCVRV